MSESPSETTTPSVPASAPRRRWKLRCCILTILLFGAAIFEARVAFLMVPNVERILMDMLVDKSQLWSLTLFIIEASHFQQKHFFVLFPPLLVIVGLLWWRRGAAWISVTTATLILLLTVLGALAFPAMLHATAMVLHNLRDVPKTYPKAATSHEQLKNFLAPEPKK